MKILGVRIQELKSLKSLRLLNVRPHFGLSVHAKPRGSHRQQTLSGGFSGLQGLFLFLNPNRLCIREQRPAEATTRTTRKGWCSRPRPVNRLQATGEPLRRVMRGGESVSLAPKNRQTRTFPNRQGKLLLSPKNSRVFMSISSRSNNFIEFCLANGYSSVVQKDLERRRKSERRIATWKRDNFAPNHVNPTGFAVATGC